MLPSIDACTLLRYMLCWSAQLSNVWQKQQRTRQRRRQRSLCQACILLLPFCLSLFQSYVVHLTAATSTRISISFTSFAIFLQKLICSFRSFQFFQRTSISSQIQQHIHCFFVAPQISSSFLSLYACVEAIDN